MSQSPLGKDAQQLGEHLEFQTNPWVIDEDSLYGAETGSTATADVGLLTGTQQAAAVAVAVDDDEIEDAPLINDRNLPVGETQLASVSTESFDAPTYADAEPSAAVEEEKDNGKEPATEEKTSDGDMKYADDDDAEIGPVLAECLDKDMGIPEKVQSTKGPPMPYDEKWRYNVSFGDVVLRRVRVPDAKTGELKYEELWFPKDGADRKVFCAFKIKRISDVSNVDETFNMRFHIYFNYICTAADYVNYCKVRASGNLQSMMAWEPQWYPHIEIQNIVDGETEWESYPEEGCFRIQHFKDFGKEKKAKVPDGQFDSAKCRFIRAKLEVEGVFAEELELQSFPFDCQDLSCTIHERTTTVSCVFVPELRKPNFASIDPRYSVIDEWDLTTAIIEMGDAEGSRSGHGYSMIVIRLKMKRMYMVYMWSIVFLVACITSLALTAFALPEMDLGPRLGLVITLILTAVAFSYVAFENLPNVPYLTCMDKYILAGYAYLVAVMIESSCLKFLGPNGDAIAFWVFFVIFVVGHIFFAIYAYILRQDELHKLTYSSDEIEDEVALQRPKIRFDYRKRIRAGNDGRLLSFTGTIDTEGMTAKNKEKAEKYNEQLNRLGTMRHEAKNSGVPKGV